MTHPDPMRPRVSVVVVNWNGAEFLEKCLGSVQCQTYENRDCLLIDNASTDGSAELVQNLFPWARVVRNRENLGFAQAANMGIALTGGEFVLLLNPDVFLESDYIEVLLRHAVKENPAGSFGGKLLRQKTGDGPDPEIDSAGLVLLNGKRRPWDRGEGETDRGQYDAAEYVMGINGAAVCYRRSMLEDVKMDGEYFDSDFFMYFEDVDLAWRSLLFGWKSLYVPQARGYHARGGARGRRNLKIRVHAARNRYLVFLKNEPFAVFTRYFFPALAVELARLAVYAVREPSSLLGFFKFVSVIPGFLRKRRRVQERTKISPEEFASWYR
ncbi:MAG: glycosyltransferase family 2 protein [Nitrospinae bacterium]|nr:glycosyltransferase family 2 protein [Nitrospinota bacterium]